jgi:predicted GTPase
LIPPACGRRGAWTIPWNFSASARSEESIARSDITVLVIDAEAGITEQDKKIADVIVESRRACIVVVNKWDLFEAPMSARRARRKSSGAGARSAPRARPSR